MMIDDDDDGDDGNNSLNTSFSPLMPNYKNAPKGPFFSFNTSRNSADVRVVDYRWTIFINHIDEVKASPEHVNCFIYRRKYWHVLSEYTTRRKFSPGIFYCEFYRAHHHIFHKFSLPTAAPLVLHSKKHLLGSGELILFQKMLPTERPSWNRVNINHWYEIFWKCNMLSSLFVSHV